jgi:hypothetical protein
MQTIVKDKVQKQPIIEQGKAETLPIDKIDFSPLNYRKQF